MAIAFFMPLIPQKNLQNYFCIFRLQGYLALIRLARNCAHNLCHFKRKDKDLSDLKANHIAQTNAIWIMQIVFARFSHCVVAFLRICGTFV